MPAPLGVQPPASDRETLAREARLAATQTHLVHSLLVRGRSLGRNGWRSPTRPGGNPSYSPYFLRLRGGVGSRKREETLRCDLRSIVALE